MIDDAHISQFHRELMALCSKWAKRVEKPVFIKHFEVDYKFTKITFGLLEEANNSARDCYEQDITNTYVNKWEA